MMMMMMMMMMMTLTMTLCHQEQHYNLVQCEVRTTPVNLCHLFDLLEQAQRDLHVEDYSVSQNSLDNVSQVSRQEKGNGGGGRVEVAMGGGGGDIEKVKERGNG